LFLEHVADNLLKDGALMNDFELNQARPERWIAEYTIYGATPEVGRTLFYMDDSEHPVYGTIHYTGNPAGMYNISKLYGESWLELKEHIKEDCTFTPVDSLQVYREQVFTWTTIEGVLASKCFHKYWYEYILDKEAPFPTGAGGSLPGYIEVQILGRVRLENDVKCIHYPMRFNHNLDLVATLQQIAQKYNCALEVF
jgi:hypothetical protein